MHVYLFDKQNDYLVNLIQMIRLYLPDCTIHANTKLMIWPISQEQPADSIICLYNALDFPDFDKRLYQAEQNLFACHYIRLIEAAAQKPEIENQTRFNRKTKKRLSKVNHDVESDLEVNRLAAFESATAALSIQSIPRTGHLHILISSLIAIDQSYVPPTEATDASNYEPVANQMICNLSFGHRDVNKWIRQLLDKSLKQGYRTIYLPLMPPYEQFLTLPPDTGPDLSDLLYRISVNLNTEEKISLYWQSSENGWLQFRPPVCSDDLLSCHPETIKMLISALKLKLKPDTEKSFIVIDCRHIPFCFVLAAATLCSQLFIQLPGGNKQARQAAEKEAAYLANQMPGTCKVTLQKADDRTG